MQDIFHKSMEVIISSMLNMYGLDVFMVRCPLYILYPVLSSEKDPAFSWSQVRGDLSVVSIFPQVV